MGRSVIGKTGWDASRSFNLGCNVTPEGFANAYYAISDARCRTKHGHPSHDP